MRDSLVRVETEIANENGIEVEVEIEVEARVTVAVNNVVAVRVMVDIDRDHHYVIDWYQRQRQHQYCKAQSNIDQELYTDLQRTRSRIEAVLCISFVLCDYTVTSKVKGDGQKK